MKHPKSTGRSRPDPAQLAAQGRGERNKMIAMSVLLVMLVGVFLWTRGNDGATSEADELPVTDSVTGTDQQVVVPAYDESALTDVSDGTEAARAVLEDEALDVLIGHVRRLGNPHFKALGVELLDGEKVRELAADPGARRGAPLRLRGNIEDLRGERRGADGDQVDIGLLTLEDGGKAFFLVLDVPDFGSARPFVRVDGLFLKLYRAETDAGWVEGPLVVGRRAERSFPDIGTVSELSPEVCAAAADDTASEITPIPFDLKWQMMAYARDLAEDVVDWDAQPELFNTGMAEIMKDGASFRCQPFRFPISKNMGTWVEDAGENPARLDAITTGWIGNTTWGVGAIKFVAPFARPELQHTDLFTARGFFLKNHAYEPRDGGIRVTPYFVMVDVEPHVPPPDHFLRNFMYAIAAVTLGMIGLFWSLLMRDKRKAAALQEELTRRRQARRKRGADAVPPPVSPGPPATPPATSGS